MRDAFKFRYVNEIAGSLVLAAVALLVAGIYFAGRAQGWFEKELVVCVRFPPEEGTFGLQDGAEIRILDTLAGRVGKVAPMDDGSIEAVLKVQGSFQKLVRRDSVVRVKKKFAVAGDAYVEIVTTGSQGEPAQPGDCLRFEKEEDILQSLTAVLQDLRARFIPIMEEVHNVLVRADDILTQVDSGKGPAGLLIGDTETAERLKQTAADLQRAVAQFPGIASNAAAVAEDARRVTGSLAEPAADLEGLINQTRETLRETERLIEALQRHWVLRKYVERPAETELIPPLQIPIPEGTRP
jgi:phospholipid/cholesterol/gamma-HCH transport system substrate-binding protein